MQKNTVDKLNRKSAYCVQLIESNPRMQKRANKLARKARAISRKSALQQED